MAEILAQKEVETKLYELAYLAPPQISAEELETLITKVKKIIEKQQGAITQEQSPHKRTLSYPIGKQKEAFFGFLRFTMRPELEPELPKILRLETNLLRQMIIAVSPQQLKEEQKQARRQAPEIGRKPYKPRKEKPQEVKPEELEKKLEEILGE